MPRIATAFATVSCWTCLVTAAIGAAPDAQELERWRLHANAVQIVRDPWGIAHVYGRSDADAVFGALYAEAEDDLERIDRNYLTALGRRAEAEGEAQVYSDLRQRLFIDPDTLRLEYASSPAYFKSLLQAWADGLNFYLAKHPSRTPRVVAHFEPWMALSFTEGSIGGDIATIDLGALERQYPRAGVKSRAGAAAARGVAAHGAEQAAARQSDVSAGGGSNGFAIAPSRSASGHALLWINPHTSFYFRAELQMTSAEGLDAYGAVTWGQFFVYQGFNEHNGWMHTSYGGDAVDEYAEAIVRKPGGLYYRYGTSLLPLRARRITLGVKRGTHTRPVSFTVYYSHHGPIVRTAEGKWIAVKLLQDPVRALQQSFLRTKTRDYAQFRATQDLRTDTSNNTVYADADGTIAYFHGNFIPRRDPRFDFTHPVDGSDPATEWQGVHQIDETITLLNPASGWIANTNNWPFSAAGESSPKREDFPVYMWSRGENPRGIHAVEVLRDIHDVTLDSLIATGYDAHLTAFDVLLPPLFAAYDRLSPEDPRRPALAAPIESLRLWDLRTGADSIPTALAIFWGQTLIDRSAERARAAEQQPYDYLVDRLTDDERLDALEQAVLQLEHDFTRWRTPWGDINRLQRLTDDDPQSFDDARPSLPVGFAPARWGALASFDAAGPRRTKRIYGTVGNSFVAAVEFGPTVRAKAIMAGGESGDPASPHFMDQARPYCEVRFRDVLFAPADVSAHAARRYHPGEP